MNASLSENSQAILLLTADLCLPGESFSQHAEPLNSEEYSQLARHLLSLKKKPADLLSEKAGALIASLSSSADAERLTSLLARRERLAEVLGLWTSRGISAVTRADARYPKALKRHLREDAPPVIWCAGRPEILQSPAVAVTGASSPADRKTAERLTRNLKASGAAAVVTAAANRTEAIILQNLIASGGRVCIIPPEGIPAAQNSLGAKLAASEGLLILSSEDPLKNSSVSAEDSEFACRRLALAAADAGVLTHADSTDDAAWLACEEMLGKYETMPVLYCGDDTDDDVLFPLLELGIQPWPETDDDSRFMEFWKNFSASLAEKRVQQIPAQKAQPAQAAASPAQAIPPPQAKPYSEEQEFLRTLQNEVSALCRRGVSAENILEGVMQELISRGKLDPVAATVIKKVSFPSLH